jgi:hypothetical protein
VHVLEARPLEEGVRGVTQRAAHARHPTDGVGTGPQVGDASQELQSVALLQCLKWKIFYDIQMILLVCNRWWIGLCEKNAMESVCTDTDANLAELAAFVPACSAATACRRVLR